MWTNFTFIYWLIGWSELLTGLVTIITCGYVRLRLDVKVAGYLCARVVDHALKEAEQEKADADNTL